jgi:CubicO group peptidase (beta-lactamase class C family)
MSGVLESIGSQLHTTAPDLATFACALLRPALSPFHAAALQPQVKVESEFLHGPPGPDAYWGFGIGVWVIKGEPTFWHWGENYGFQGFLAGWPAQRNGIVVLTNSDHGHHVSKAALAAFDGKDYPAIAWIEN